jgi:hypothetical protein
MSSAMHPPPVRTPLCADTGGQTPLSPACEKANDIIQAMTAVHLKQKTIQTTV